jgi:hypothetical protein
MIQDIQFRIRVYLLGYFVFRRVTAYNFTWPESGTSHANCTPTESKDGLST